MTVADAQPDWPDFSSGDDPLETVVKLSRYYGQLPGFVIAGGGNTSVKDGGTLYVKASGTQLATIGREGFVALERAPLQRLCKTELSADAGTREAQFKEAILAARLEPWAGQRPSVEALLHHLLPAKFVVHSHAALVNAVTCCVNGPQIARELFGDEALWIPYVDPGYVLARTLREMLAARTAAGKMPPQVIFMANHGLIVAGDSPDEVRVATARVIDAIGARLRDAEGADSGDDGAAFPAAASTDENQPDAAKRHTLIHTIGPALRALLAESTTLKVVTFDDSPLVASFVAGDAAKTLPFEGPLNPDQIVYCNSFPLYFEPDPDETADALIERLRAAIADHRERHGYLPRVTLVRGVGLFAAGDDPKSAATARDLYKDAIEILAGATRLGGATFLSVPHREFIEQWEVEAYRKQIAAGSAAKGRAAGKIAVVTGAAQGFGLEIAQALAAAGAVVILADVNVAGARAAAEILCGSHGKGRALGLQLDVTHAASVAACIDQVVRTYGGFDVFISNAGVLKAESVKTQSERDFDLVTDVNYKGYFLCVQKAAPILAVQHQAKVDYLSDIIQINSKSGLEGSNKNAAYAGSKFGGLGLTQSFALELVTDGIKVNAICPGNFFDGPLWSDPQNGLFAQYLRTGKVPGAKTIADVQKFYEAKVPMARGCTTADVMHAVFYLMDQRFETGQAVPVTGGQVMLN